MRAANAAERAALAGITQRLVPVDRSHVDRYRRDPFAHLDEGHVTIQDLETGAPVAFKPYPHEEELAATWINLDQLDHGVLVWRNLHEEKSRAMGITWTAAWCYLWALMYWPVRLIVTHLKVADIDNGGSASTPDSFFGKIRYMAEADSWPEHLAPGAFLHYRQAPEHVITSSLANGYLVGEGAVSDVGRGGQYDAALVDEAARIPFGQQVEESLTNACPRGRFYNSTPYGEDNVYAQIKQSRSREFVFLRHHWTIHPLYRVGLHVAGLTPEEQPTGEQARNAAGCALCDGNRRLVGWDAETQLSHRYPGRVTSPWYDRKVAEILRDDAIAQELDISYSRSLSARVLPEFDEDTHVRDHIPWDPYGQQIELSWDFGLADATSIGVWQETGRELRKLGEVEVNDLTPEDVTPLLRNELARLGVPEEQLVPQTSALLFQGIGDPSGASREIGTGVSLFSRYAALGFSIMQPDTRGVLERINAFKNLMLGRPKRVAVSRSGCPRTIRHYKAWRWPTDAGGNVRSGATKPLHDQHSHMCDADSYLIVGKYGAPDDSDPIPPDPMTPSSMSSLSDLIDPRTGRIDAGLTPDMKF